MMWFVKKYQTIREYFRFERQIIWRNAFGILALYLSAFYGLFFLVNKMKFYTYIWSILVGYISGVGVTAGAHRLWTHRSYKAKLPLRIFLMISYLLTGEYSIVQWARDHRIHHKYSDTDADPHNANRGFFYSHCGWLMMKRHPELKAKGKQIDLSDLWADPVVVFQQKYFIPLLITVFIIIPCAVPYYFWNERLDVCIFVIWLLRYAVTINVVWSVNSVAHFFGTKPYNKNIRAVQNVYVSTLGFGEGWHNYHHIFPWDYRTSEFSSRPNTSARFIELCSKLGLAYDLKTASPELIDKIQHKTGDKAPVNGIIKMDEEILFDSLSKEFIKSN